MNSGLDKHELNIYLIAKSSKNLVQAVINCRLPKV